MLHSFFEPFFPQIETLCAEHRVAQLWFFGSATTKKFRAGKSDLDLLAEFLPNPDALERGRNALLFSRKLEKLLGLEVDLLTVGAIRNPFFKAEIDATKVLFYEAQREAIFV